MRCRQRAGQSCGDWDGGSGRCPVVKLLQCCMAAQLYGCSAAPPGHHRRWQRVSWREQPITCQKSTFSCTTTCCSL
ncbi:hypothetical protein SKAU_G00167310 [Synaphobranchus kaupii]|uniref:Uncharacterized protein n=1 Tax=Synaphobranchus kaupii TaxID=118154 RepID=A0A9Q1FJU7_SYNKA|nr:hypothetical protein SKAU_G00167310 [Synaphobranchus kaupii]